MSGTRSHCSHEHAYLPHQPCCLVKIVLREPGALRQTIQLGEQPVKHRIGFTHVLPHQKLRVTARIEEHFPLLEVTNQEAKGRGDK